MKKFLSIFLATLFLFPATAFAEPVSLTDSQKAELYFLGIMTGDENGDLRLNDTITRAETAKMLCCAASLNATATESAFADVSVNHWASAYIAALYESGIVNGDENGNFCPEDSVTNEEVVKMLVALLGYSFRAEQMSGYPAGYTAVAADLGITSDLHLDPNTPAVRNDAAMMIHRALDIPLMQEEDDDLFIILDGNAGTPHKTLRTSR